MFENILEHLLKGGEVIYKNESEKLKLAGFVLTNNKLLMDANPNDLYYKEDFNDMQIFIHPLQKEINRLQDIITIQHEKIEQMMMKDKKVRKTPNKLTDIERQEVVQKYKFDTKISKTELAKIFNVSNSVIGQILDKAGVAPIVHRR